MVMNSSIKCRIRVGIFCWLRKRWFRTKGSIQVRCAYHGSAIIDCHRKTIFLIPVSRSLRSDQDKSHEREAWIYAPPFTNSNFPAFSLFLCFSLSWRFAISLGLRLRYSRSHSFRRLYNSVTMEGTTACCWTSKATQSYASFERLCRETSLTSHDYYATLFSYLLLLLVTRFRCLFIYICG